MGHTLNYILFEKKWHNVAVKSIYACQTLEQYKLTTTKNVFNSLALYIECIIKVGGMSNINSLYFFFLHLCGVYQKLIKSRKIDKNLSVQTPVIRGWKSDPVAEFGLSCEGTH